MKMKIGIIIISIIILLVVLIRLYIGYHPVFGGKPVGVGLDRVINSPNYKDGSFQNTEPTVVMAEGGSMMTTMWEWIVGPENGKPDSIVTQEFDKVEFLKDADSSFKVTWFGHSSVLLNVENKIILIDPVFSKYASPVPFTNGSFNFTVDYSADNMPDIDVLLISHDHYDHLDMNTIKEIDHKVASYYVPLGVEAHLIKWGVDKNKITIADWWDEFIISDNLTLASTPARHFSGRGTVRNTTLWCSWVIKSSGGNVYFGADSGYGKHFKKIGDKYGPFKLTMIECGQYNKNWPNIHAMPEQSVQAHIDVQGQKMMAIHWSKFQLALHSWTDPIERARAEAAVKEVDLIEPIIGDVFEIDY